MALDAAPRTRPHRLAGLLSQRYPTHQGQKGGLTTRPGSTSHIVPSSTQALFNWVAPASRRLWKGSSVIKSCEGGFVSAVNPSHQGAFPGEFSQVGRGQRCPNTSHSESWAKNINGKIFPANRGPGIRGFFHPGSRVGAGRGPGRGEEGSIRRNGEKHASSRAPGCTPVHLILTTHAGARWAKGLLP